MSDTADLDRRRKQALYRSTHRGNKENDILLGQFALATIDDLTAEQIDEFERLLDVPDNDIFDWVGGRSAVPPQHDTSVFRLLAAFRVRF